MEPTDWPPPESHDGRSIDVVTLTLNPALDISTAVDTIEPWRKLRCDHHQIDPGGGGVNVARGTRQLGGRSAAVVAVGGHVGSLLADEIHASGVDLHAIRVHAPTRQNFAVTERSTGCQYRFVQPGGEMSENELEMCVEALLLAAPRARCVVASGSLPDGVSPDAFARLAAPLQSASTPYIVDTSGPALAAAIEMPVTLVKPSVNELRGISGEPLLTLAEVESVARDILDRGQCGAIVVSMGAEGAVLVSRDGPSLVLRAPAVEAVSASGAGDSMVAGIALGIARGESLREATRRGVAAGTAAVLAHGTSLCHAADVDRLLAGIDIAFEPLRSATHPEGEPRVALPDRRVLGTSTT